MKKSKKEISDIIYNELGYIYCDNCRYNSELVTKNREDCECCVRKSMGWEISKMKCNIIADKILKQCEEE